MFSMNKKVRNRLLALVCLGAFAALGTVFYKNWVVQKPFAVIVFLVDNLTPSVLAPARIYQGGADHRLRLEKLPRMALATVHSGDHAVPDAAAAAGAIATGHKPNNGELGTHADGQRQPTLLEIAKQRGRSTGIVSNASLTDATAAAFYASTRDPLDHAGIARQLVGHGGIDVLLGGGAADFLPRVKDGRRRDGADLFLEMMDEGFGIVRDSAGLEEVPGWRSPRLLGVFADGNLDFADEFDPSGSQPSLADMVRNAIRLLQYNRRGYLLVVDAALAGKAGTQNEAERTLREILALDEAVATAIDYAGANSLVVVAGKLNTGGLRLNGHPFRNDKGAALLGINPRGVPSMTWSTGPGSGTRNSPDGPRSSEPAAAKQAAGLATAEDAVVTASGPGTEAISGFIDNTRVFEIVRDQL
jgi:alkaline phosphatase